MTLGLASAVDACKATDRGCKSLQLHSLRFLGLLSVSALSKLWSGRKGVAL
jgi:hypothetical protein